MTTGPETSPLVVLVDADACPVKDEIYRVAGRHGIKTYIVSNSFLQVPRDPLIERVVDAHTALAHVRSSKSPKPGTQLVFEGGIEATMLERQGELFCLHFAGRESVYELLARHGHLPLPPYIERAADDEDDSRYQTVYAKHQGAVAAPTAGLHFTDELLTQLKAKGVHMAEVTLHVGAGTFQPVRVDNIAEHKMHSEWYEVSPAVVAAIEAAKACEVRMAAEPKVFRRSRSASLILR